MIDLVGQRNDNFIVLEYSHYDKQQYKHFWKCECKCGNIVLHDTFRFKQNKIKNCIRCKPVNRAFNRFKAKVTEPLLVVTTRKAYEASQKEDGKESNHR